MGNAIIATPKLTIGANNVSNVQSGKILGDDIAIQAKNEVVSGTSASIKSNQIAIDADHFHGSNSEILATDNIDIKTSEYANTANISSQNTATLSIKNGGDFYSDQTQRAPQAEQLLTINAHDVTTNIELNNPGSIHINASGDVHNNQGIVTGKSLVVKAAGAIENAAEQIVFAAQDLILEAGTAISNLQDAQILGLGNVSLTASEVTNDRGRITSGADMSIDADTLTNRGAATGTAAVAGHSFVVGNYDWPHDGRSTSIIVGMNLPYYKSEISVTQAVIESSGDLNINQGAKHGRGGHITNADSLLTAAGNIKVDGNLSNTSTEASKSLYQLLNGTGEVTIGAQDSLAPLNPTKKIYASLWDLLSNTYGSDNNDHTIFAAYKYYDEDMSKTLQNTYNPVFNQLMSATFGADWRGLSRDELSNRFKNLQPSASLAFSGDKQAEISAGGTFTHTGGAFTNGGQQKVQQTVQVKVGDETISTLQGNFDRTFNSGVLFDFSKTPSLAELTAALNPQNVLERLMQTRALFDIHSAPPPLMLDVSKIGNRLSTSALGAEVARVNTSIVTTPVAASAPQAFTPIYPVYETRIPYITLKTFYGSQYFFDKIDYHSDRTVPVIGDAFFDNQLITQSIQETVGGYFAAKDGLSGAELVKTLMDNAALEAVAQGLHFGEPLTQAQYKNLTHNIIWYEPKVVNGYTVLSPRVYLSRATLEDVANNKATTAVVASRGQLSIDASKVSNVDAAIHGGSVYIHSADSIHNQNTGGGTGGISAGDDGDVVLEAKNDVNNLGATVDGKHVTLKAGGDINVTAAMTYDTDGSLVSRNASGIYGNGDDSSVTLDAGKNINLTGAEVSGTTVKLKAAKDLNVQDVHEVESSYHNETTHTLLSVANKTSTSTRATSNGSELKGDHLVLDVGGNTTIVGGNVDFKDTTGNVAGNFKVEAAKNLSATKETSYTEGMAAPARASAAGFEATSVSGAEGTENDAQPLAEGGMAASNVGGVTAGFGYQKTQTSHTNQSTIYTNSQLNLGSGKLTVGGVADIGGADLNTSDATKDAKLNVKAKSIETTKYQNVVTDENSSENNSFGITYFAGSTVLDVSNENGKVATSAANGKSVSPLLAASIVGDATQIAFGAIGSAGNNFGYSRSTSKSLQHTVSDNITHVGGNVSFESTEGDINLNGVQTMDNTHQIELNSAGKVNMTAAKTETTKASSSDRLLVGVNASAGATFQQAGLGGSAVAEYGQENTSATRTAYTNTHIGGDVVIKSKGDTNLTGANVTGHVTTDIGGKLNITSQQDTQTLKHNQSSGGAGLGVALSTNGPVPVANAHGEGGDDWDNYSVVGKQSGITGDPSSVVKVKGDINLLGGKIDGGSHVVTGGDVNAVALVDSHEKDGGYGGAGGGLNAFGAITASAQGGQVSQVHYVAVNNATIDGPISKMDSSGAILADGAGPLIHGVLNTDANREVVVLKNQIIAADDIKVEVAPIGIGKKGGDETDSPPSKPPTPPEEVTPPPPPPPPPSPPPPPPPPPPPEPIPPPPPPKPVPPKPQGDTGDGGRVGNSLEYHAIRRALNTINAHDFDASTLQKNPLKLAVTLSPGKTETIVISKPSDLMQLEGRPIYMGQTSQGIGRGGNALQYAHVVPLGDGQYTVRFKSRPPSRR
nr:hemagglutinin repeat-containing protein [Pseudomonas koreensis]